MSQQFDTITCPAHQLNNLQAPQRFGKQVAIKFLERGERINETYVSREICNHSQLLHPHIVQFKEVFLTPKHLGICMEYAEASPPPLPFPPPASRC